MSYFVTVNGLEVTPTTFSKDEAIKKAIKLHDENPKLGAIQIGIGKIKYVKGEKRYTLLPYLFYLNN